MAAKKELTSQVKLQVPAGAANPSPPVGPALGQAGVNIMDFCKAFNDKTKDIEKNAPIPVVINVYKDRSFDFETKLPPVSFYLKKACNIKKGSGAVGKEAHVATISQAKIKEVAETKMQDMNSHSIESAMNMVKGQCISMGIKVEDK